LEAEQAEALAWLAREKRNELADEYHDELRTNGRQTIFRNKLAHAEYAIAWGPDSDRANAYRERQRERGLPETDPVKLDRV
jgi:hypothetical protein